MAKNIEITTGYLGEEMTIKSALTEYLKDRQDTLKRLKKVWGSKFVPNQHLYIAHINNCKSLLKKL